MARFTEEQKKELDEKMKKFCADANRPLHMYGSDIAEYLGYNELTTMQIQASLNRIDVDYAFTSARNREKGFFEINYMEDMGQYKAVAYPLPFFTKDKNILKILCANSKKNKTKRLPRIDYYKLHYDFATKTFFVVDTEGKKVDDVKVNCDEIQSFIDKKCFDYEWIYNYIGERNISCEDTNRYYEVKTLIEVRDIIDTFNHYNLNCSIMPKGLFNFIEEDCGVLTEDTIKEWYLNSLGETEKEKNFISQNRWWSDFEDFIPELVKAKLKIKDFMKVISNSIETTYINDITDFGARFMDAFLKYAKLDKVKDFVFDTNRDLETNRRLLEMACNKEKFEALGKQLQKINFINGLTIGGYVVKVPQSQLDKIDEGMQQNNCVGSYYDDSILEGQNFIYFIRKATNPNKSYITCRYHVTSKDTIEYRYKNNADVDNKEEIEIIEKISDIIKNYLEK